MRLKLGGRSVVRGGADLSDLTASSMTAGASWEDEGRTLVLPFDPEPSASEQRLIRRRLLTRDSAHEAWVAAVVAAYDDVAVLATLPAPVVTLLRLLTQGALDGIETIDQEA